MSNLCLTTKFVIVNHITSSIPCLLVMQESMGEMKEELARLKEVCYNIAPNFDNCLQHDNTVLLVY